MNAKVFIKETREDHDYEGTIELPDSLVKGKLKLFFKFNLKLSGEEMDKNFPKTGSPEEMKKFVKENTTLSITKEDGQPTGLTSEQEDLLCFQPISFAYSLLIDKRKKGLGNEKTFKIPMVYF